MYSFVGLHAYIGSETKFLQYSGEGSPVTIDLFIGYWPR